MALLKARLRGEPVWRMQKVLGVECDGAFGRIAGPDTFMMMGLWELMLLDNGSKGEAVKKLQEKLGVPATASSAPAHKRPSGNVSRKTG
jgi:hypothetical protein